MTDDFDVWETVLKWKLGTYNEFGYLWAAYMENKMRGEGRYSEQYALGEGLTSVMACNWEKYVESSGWLGRKTVV